MAFSSGDRRAVLTGPRVTLLMFLVGAIGMTAASAQNAPATFAAPFVRLFPRAIAHKVQTTSDEAGERCSSEWDLARLETTQEAAWEAARAARRDDQESEDFLASEPAQLAGRASAASAEPRAAVQQWIELTQKPGIS